MNLRSRFRGCLLGGAVGDALGAPIEFESLERIRARHGPHGLTDLVPAYGRLGAITDDTQMTLFTAEGVIRAVIGEEEDPVAPIWESYQRWMHTQDEPVQEPAVLGRESRGWLIEARELHARRAPGLTCLSGLKHPTPLRLGRDAPINDSKGCGGVMRAAPCGMVGGYDSFELGCQSAYLSHNHALGYQTAGVLAVIIGSILGGTTLPESVREGVAKSSGPLRKILEHSVALAKEGAPEPQKVASLGQGWVAEQALAIAVYCALAARDFDEGVLLAVNHSGDSDSTGSIAGNILGAAHGVDSIPRDWTERLELREVIETVADDLLLAATPGAPGRERLAERYPPSMNA